MTRFSLFIALAFTTSVLTAQNNILCKPETVVCEDFESYSGTYIGPQSPIWTTWSGVEGTAEDGILSTTQSVSGTKSMLIQEAPASGTPQDVLLLLGNKTTGAWDLRWRMFIPPNKDAYYNMQNVETPAVAWNFEVYFGDLVEGQGRIGGVTGTTFIPWTTFNFPHGQWFEMIHHIDLDNNRFLLYIKPTNSVPTLVVDTIYNGNIGAIDYFSVNANNRYWVDDVRFTPIPNCPADALICDLFETYAAGQTTTSLAAWWSDAGPTTAGTVVESVQAISGFQFLELPTGDFAPPGNVLLNLGNKTSGAYRLSYKVQTSGSLAMRVLKSNTIAGVQTAALEFANGSYEFQSGPAGSVNGLYLSGWNDVEWFFNVEQDSGAVVVNGALAGTFKLSHVLNATGTNKTLGALQFEVTNGFLPGGIIDDVIFREVPVPPVFRQVTFKVSMWHLVHNGGTISPDGIHVAGSFQELAGYGGNWIPNATPMIPVADNVDQHVYAVTVSIPNGTYQYKFINGNQWQSGGVQFSEQNIALHCNQTGGNRIATITSDTTLRFCFDYCEPFCLSLINSADDISAPQLSLTPNPAADFVVVHNPHNNLPPVVYDHMGRRYDLSSMQTDIHTHRLDVTNLHNGLYIVRAGEYYIRFLINR